MFQRSFPNICGKTIDAGRLFISDILGAGSNGIVFLAEDTASPSTHIIYYAVKCMRKAEFDTKEFWVQKQEVQNHTAVSSHSNVVTLHRIFEEGKYLFLVMDYYPRGDLYRFMADGYITRGRGNDALIKSLILQIISAVRACHQLGIFHRDIKPENIMVSTDGTRVFLADFGLSTSERYSATFGCGSRLYMSPECLVPVGSDAYYSTRANDVWAIGVILTAMISGHHPWRKASMTDGCFSAYVRNPTFLRRSLPVSNEVHDVLKRVFSPAATRVTLEFMDIHIKQIDSFYEPILSLPPPRRSFFQRRWQRERKQRPAPKNELEAALEAIAAADTTPYSHSINSGARSGSSSDSSRPRTPDMTAELLALPSLSQLPSYTRNDRSDLLVAAEDGQARSPPSSGVFRRIVGKLSLP